MQVLIPKFAAAFVGTGDLFTALSTAWLARTGGDLKLALEKTIGTMQVRSGLSLVCQGLSHHPFQAVLGRTMQHADAAAAAAGLDKPTAAMMELKLIQSKQEIENPPGGSQAAILCAK